MAKDLPYFKFTPTEWLTGDINYEEYEVQGLFINICCVYWQRQCKMTLEDLEKRYKKPNALGSLIGRFISVNENKGGLISIKFLDELLKDTKKKSETNSKNGSKGGRPKTPKGSVDIEMQNKANAKRTLSEQKPKKSNKEEEKEKEEDIYNQVIELFNSTTGKKITLTPQREKLINARIAEGKKLEDFEKVVKTKFAEWAQDKKMKQYITPETLFAGTNFQKYLEQDQEIKTPVISRREGALPNGFVA